MRAATLARISLVALVVATFLAIFYAQRLKREDPLLDQPIGSTTVTFQPIGTITGAHVDRFAHFRIRATVKDTLAVSIVNERTGRVEIVIVVAVHAYRHRSISWDGRAQGGALAPAGLYRLSVHFEHGGQTVRPPLQLRLVGPRP